MIIIEPHIHMVSRTTDDYQAMYAAGIRACVEPSFWMGINRTRAGTFIDYFRLILDWETIRARRFGIDHFAGVSVNPKEAEDLVLAREVIAEIGPYLDHPRCVALGEVGLNAITPNEETILAEQLALVVDKELPVLVHLPHFNKPEGIRRIMAILAESGIADERVLIDHNTEDTMPLARGTGYHLGLTVYPISKLTPQRVSHIIRHYGHERMIVSGSADWGVSDPLSLVKVVNFLREDGHPDAVINDLVFNNANRFYANSPRWKPELGLIPVDPREFQR